MLLASVDPNTRNGSVVIGSKEGSMSKGILPQFVRSLVRSCDEGTPHEGLGKHFREAELRISQERAILPKVLPQIRQNHREDGLAGALMLKLIQHKDTLGQVSDGALGLGFSSQCLLTFVHPLFRSCDSCLFSFFPP